MNTTKKLGIGGGCLAAILFAVAPSPARAQQPPDPPAVNGPQDFSAGSFFASENLGWLGVGVADVTPDQAKELKMASAYGVSVTEVGDGSPAAKTGFKKGDVITEYNGMRVEGAAQFRRLVRETPPGHTAAISIWRNGRTEKFSVELGHAPELPSVNQFFGRGPEVGRGPRDFGPRPQTPLLPGQAYGDRGFGFANTPTLGVSAMDLSAQLGEYFGSPNGEGVLVTEVHKGTPGEKAGLKAGDVITKVNGAPVRNIGELRQHLREARSSKAATLNVLRKGSEISITAELEAPRDPENGRNSGSLDRRIPL